MSTKALADFAAGIRYESLPSEVIAKAKASVRDFLGVALYVSRNTPWGQTIARFAVKQGYGACGCYDYRPWEKDRAVARGVG